MTPSVLIIEDETDIAMLIKRHLQDLSCDVKVVFDGVNGLHDAQSGSYDLVILDLMLPEIDGLEIARRLRAQSNHTPILMLTARTSEDERVLGLESGADDYLTKPFSIAELDARVNAIFRRVVASSSTALTALAVIRIGDLMIEASKREVTLRGQPVVLTDKEFDLLLHFARNPGRVYTRAELHEALWGHAYDECEYAINRHINRLRSKIEADHANPQYVMSVRGRGYQFVGGESRKRR